MVCVLRDCPSWLYIVLLSSHRKESRILTLLRSYMNPCNTLQLAFVWFNGCVTVMMPGGTNKWRGCGRMTPIKHTLDPTPVDLHCTIQPALALRWSYIHDTGCTRTTFPEMSIKTSRRRITGPVIPLAVQSSILMGRSPYLSPSLQCDRDLSPSLGRFNFKSSSQASRLCALARPGGWRLGAALHSRLGRCPQDGSPPQSLTLSKSRQSGGAAPPNHQTTPQLVLNSTA